MLRNDIPNTINMGFHIVTLQKGNIKIKLGSETPTGGVILRYVKQDRSMIRKRGSKEKLN